MSVEQKDEKPPVGELVLSLQFEPLSQMNSGHFGKFWQEVFPDLRCDPDSSPIDDQFEDLVGPMKFVRGFSIAPAPYPGRMVLSNKAGDRLCQIQRSRYVHNWRSAGSEYPTYSPFLTDFLDGLNKFKTFVEKNGLGSIASNQWELVYVDVFPENEDWNSLEEWSKVLPGLFTELSVDAGLKLCNRNAAWSFDLEEVEGRMHISANLGQLPGQSSSQHSRALLVNTTVRGPIYGWDLLELKNKFNFARQVATGSFKKFVAPSILQRCK